MCAGPALHVFMAPVTNKFNIVLYQLSRDHSDPIHLSSHSLGVTFNSDLSFKEHISFTCQISFLHTSVNFVKSDTCLISTLLLPSPNLLLHHALTIATLFCLVLPTTISLSRLQRVQNVLARVIIPSIKRYDHITPTFHTLHWLPSFQQSIEY